MIIYKLYIKAVETFLPFQFLTNLFLGLKKQFWPILAQNFSFFQNPFLGHTKGENFSRIDSMFMGEDVKETRVFSRLVGINLRSIPIFFPFSFFASNLPEFSPINPRFNFGEISLLLKINECSLLLIFSIIIRIVVTSK